MKLKTQNKLIRYTSIGLLLSLLAVSGVEAKTLVYQKTLNKEIGISTQSCSNYIKSGQPSSGQVVLANPTNKPIVSNLTMRIIGHSTVDKQNIISSLPTQVSIKIPAFQEVVYKFKNGASAIVSKDISAYILMKTDNGEKKGTVFKILAPYTK